MGKFFRADDQPKREPRGELGPGAFGAFGSTRPVRTGTVNSGDAVTDNIISDLRTALRKANALLRDSGAGR